VSVVRLSKAQVGLFGQGRDGGEVDVELVAGDDRADGGLVPASIARWGLAAINASSAQAELGGGNLKPLEDIPHVLL
jgi:hypothetical protein